MDFLAAAAIGTIWSSSPCAMKIGTSSDRRFSVWSVSENALTQSHAAARPTSMPWRQKSLTVRHLRTWTVPAVERRGQVLPELGAVIQHVRAQGLECFDR